MNASKFQLATSEDLQPCAVRIAGSEIDSRLSLELQPLADFR